MTEEEQNNLAKKIAKIVVEEIDKRQEEYDKEFMINLAEANKDLNSLPQSTLEILLQLKDNFEKDIASAIRDERYEDVGPLKNELALINYKILQTKHEQ